MEYTLDMFTESYINLSPNNLSVFIFCVENGLWNNEYTNALLYLADTLDDNEILPIKILLKHNINVNIVNVFEETPLMLACKKNKYNVICELINYGANVNLCDNKKRNCLMHALNSMIIDTRIIKILLENNVLIGHISYEGKSVFDYAISNNNLNEKVCDLLFSGKKISFPRNKKLYNTCHLLILPINIFVYMLQYVQLNLYFVKIMVWYSDLCNIRAIHMFNHLNKISYFVFNENKDCCFTNKHDGVFLGFAIDNKHYNIINEKLRKYKKCLTLLLSIKKTKLKNFDIINLIYIFKNNRKIINSILD